jgi:hypothetical protein
MQHDFRVVEKATEKFGDFFPIATLETAVIFRCDMAEKLVAGHGVDKLRGNGCGSGA